MRSAAEVGEMNRKAAVRKFTRKEICMGVQQNCLGKGIPLFNSCAKAEHWGPDGHVMVDNSWRKTFAHQIFCDGCHGQTVSNDLSPILAWRPRAERPNALPGF